MTANVPAATLAWVHQHLEPGERVVRSEPLHGGITAEVRRLIVSTRAGSPRNDRTRDLVLRGFVSPFTVAHAADWLRRESAALALLAGTGVPAPALVAVDAKAAHCAYPSLLMTHLPGRTVIEDEGVAARVPALARHLVAIHAVRPAERPRRYVALTTAESVAVPDGADTATWAAAIDLIRRPAPPYEGRFLHRDFQPGNVLFAEGRITGVVDWAGASWGPADLDVAHCATVLALLHGPAWGRRFVAAYEQAGGTLATAPEARLYWLVRDALAASEEVAEVTRPWREAGRTELTPRAVAERLDAYVAGLMRGTG